ncbi:hypothetical protein BV898_14066 [Hypsibius exemplaris]|uniref:Uncharacterized protein n=1 Tax=Hypsibius exemplaris TaxID=2072580 RepID=A0A1W0W8V4_HYPEX|nr:hypothetical protein BV898_14066 [Hypsibius exemplaris]
MPQFASGYYSYKDDFSYPYHMDSGYPPPHLPFYDGPIQFLEHQYPAIRKDLELHDSTEPYGREFEEQMTRSIGCQTDYRAQSAQTDPAELGVKLRETFRDFDTIYPKHCHPFTMKTMSLIKRGLQRRGLREHFTADHTADDPAELQFGRMEKEKWEFLGAEMQEWYDVNIWRRYYAWTKLFTKRKIAEWQINPPDVELLKEVPEVFAHDARRYVPKTNQGDVISGLSWNNRTDYFLDTWEGFSHVLQDMNPKHLQADVYLPTQESMYGAKGYVKRKFKEVARFEKMSFTFDDTEYDDSDTDLTSAKKPKKRHPVLLRPMPLTKRQKPMLQVPAIDVEHQAAYRAGVTIQKIFRGRGMQKMARFIDSFLSTLEAQMGTRVLRDSHYTLVRHLEFQGVERLKRYAEAQRRMREAKEAGRRQQDYRRYAEKEESVQLFQLNHHVPAERAVTQSVLSAEAHMARVAARVEEEHLWNNMVTAERSMEAAMNQQEKETFIASMIYSVMIPDVQRTLIREKQNTAAESRRLAIHQTLFGSIAKLNHEMKRRHADYPDNDNDLRPDALERDCPTGPRNILPVITRPNHRLDRHGKSYVKYIRRRNGFMRSLDTQHNFCRETQLKAPTSDVLYDRYQTDGKTQDTEIGLRRFQEVVDRVMEKVGGYSAIRPRNLLKARRRRSLRRFDRIDQSKICRIGRDKRLELTRGQHQTLAEVFEERSDEARDRVERSRLRRKRARTKAMQLWRETKNFLQEKVKFYRLNRVRPFGLDPLQHDFHSPKAELTGEFVSRYDVADLAKMPAVTLTVHTTGSPTDEDDDVVVINELVQRDFIPRQLPEDEYIRSRIVQAKLNG